MTPLPSRLRASAQEMRSLESIVRVAPRIARELEEAAQATRGMAERHPRCGYPYCACVGQCFAASQPGATAGVATDGGTEK